VYQQYRLQFKQKSLNNAWTTNSVVKIGRFEPNSRNIYYAQNLFHLRTLFKKGV